MIRLDSSDTIAAIASPPGPALRGIVRLSGPLAVEMARDLFQPDEPWAVTTRPEHRAGRFPVSALDRSVSARLIVWPGSGSYTGQPSAEVHTTGSPPILQAILADVIRSGARLAEPGEFTLRAFLSGRIDLTRAEAVLGVIEAQDPAQLETALAQLAGGVAGPIETLRDRLLDLLAHIEANLDFADEPDVDPVGRSRIASELADASAELRRLADQMATRERTDSRPRVLLYGPPNAGKSRLFNAMAGGSPALVSAEPGTTRDYLSALCVCDGLEVELVDTSGVESPRDAIEQRASEIRERELASADLVLLCQPADDSGPIPNAPEWQAKRRVLRITTKCDLVNDGKPLPTSAATGEGLDALRSAIDGVFRVTAASNAVQGTSERCRESLIRASESLQSASATMRLGDGEELVAIDLRQTLDDLGRVVGETVADDVLDRIFRRFCIGK